MSEEKNMRSRGVVSRFHDQKGYGFIQPDEGGDDLFVHQTAIKADGFRTLREGQEVEFTIILDGDKTKAIEVTAPGGGPVDSISRRGNERGSRGGGVYGFNGRRNSGNGYGYRSGGGGGGECYNCGEFGHIARDCNGGSIIGDGSGCYNCGGYGHMARDCNTRGINGNGSGCYNCGGYGHMARDCSSVSPRGGGGNIGACFNCGEPGHIARDCRGGGNSRGGGGYGRFGGGIGGAGGGKCFKCGETGHFARECTEMPRD